MREREDWLHVALRARQAQTLGHAQRLQRARFELLEAGQRESASRRNLLSVGESWTSLRRAASPNAALEGAYRLFHDFLRDEAQAARETERARRFHVEAAVAELQQSHAAQQTLEKVARQAAERRRRELQAKESREALEAWLLGRWGRPWEPMTADFRSGGFDDSDTR